MADDASNGWDAVAEELIAYRSNIGRTVVRTWAASLPSGGSVLDIGAGSGVPHAADLIEDGFNVAAIDASPKLVAAFRERFPMADVACEPAERSQFFNRQFDGAMAIGLMFLLPSDSQRELIQRVARALKPQGRFLFTAPWQVHAWNDNWTGRRSISLGRENYQRHLADAGFRLIGEHVDEGENHYYEALRTVE